jgi:hypothetical protein
VWEVCDAPLTFHAVADQAGCRTGRTVVPASADRFTARASAMLEQHASLSRTSPTRSDRPEDRLRRVRDHDLLDLAVPGAVLRVGRIAMETRRNQDAGRPGLRIQHRAAAVVAEGACVRFSPGEECGWPCGFGGLRILRVRTPSVAESGQRLGASVTRMRRVRNDRRRHLCPRVPYSRTRSASWNPSSTSTR